MRNQRGKQAGSWARTVWALAGVLVGACVLPLAFQRVILPAGKPLRTRINPADGAEMAWIPPGTFLMGSTAAERDQEWNRFTWHQHGREYSNDEDRHQVRITRGFWLYRTEVTNAQYRKFLDANPNQRKPGYWDDAQYNQPEQPVVGVSWDDVQKYCEWAKVRLPTEAEWEYAARGGNTGLEGRPRYSFVWGNDLPRTGEAVGNVCDQSAARGGIIGHYFPGYDDGYARLAPAGRFRANGYGLYDMAGNVWEWCADYYAEGYYRRAPMEDPRNDANNSHRSLRGGSWFHSPKNVRVADRNRDVPGYRDFVLGFRPAAAAVQDN